MNLDRHQLVYLYPAFWSVLFETHPDTRDLAELADWAMLGRPLIARRRFCSDSKDSVPLGLPLPPSLGKKRLSFVAPLEAVASTASPPRIADVINAAPVTWRPALEALLEVEPNTRCFGSLAWQFLTDLPYLSETSDIDLLWYASTLGDVDRIVAAIKTIDAASMVTLDGEIVTPGGLAIQWREWASGAHEVLAKSSDGNRLVARDMVFS
ncbi:malonate decarboxylase holo-[acyl-carrier-protein] synthase [Agrobacterium cavarae]